MTQDEFNQIWNTVPVGLYRTSLKDGMFIKANPFCAKLLGYEIEELIGKMRSSDLYCQDRRKELVDILEKDGVVTDFEICLKSKNGRQIWVSATGKLFKDEGYIDGSLMDITERKEIEIELNRVRANEVTLLNNLQKEIHKRLSEFTRIPA